ncbi:MAG: SDR family oxidoreductase [Bacteroidia bacterium]|nr:SDR family oxidoreductase [Bacteroidia bacterium]
MNILISGASRGIGYQMARQAAIHPENLVVALARNREKLEALRMDVLSALPSARLYVLPFDLAAGDYHVLSHKLSEIANKFDLLINNAGWLVNKPLRAMEAEEFDTMYKINTRAAFLLSKMLLPRMPSGAQIINISSMGGFQGSEKFPGLGLYSSTKGALAVLTEAMATEWKSLGITVNCLCLGAVDTEMFHDAFPGYTAAVTPEHMAEFILDFARIAPGVMNGRILPVTLSNPK